MSNKIITFTNEELGFNVRTRYIDGECRFVGKDVAQSLGYRDTKSALIDHVFPDYKRVLNAKTIDRGINDNLSQHDIYEACKSKLDAWQKLINE